MRIILLGDCHFGVRNDSEVFHNSYRKFYSQELFPYMEKHGIDHILQTGDIFDRRKYVNFNSLHLAKEYFFDVIDERGYVLDMVLGNHDIFFKNTLAVNSPELLLKEYENIHIIKEPTTISFKGMDIDMIPWICQENELRILKFIKNSKSRFCFGHFELAGFEMDRGNICHEGWDSKVLKQYDLVISGHFHHKSHTGNILYVGAPCEHTWVDWNDPKGFHVIDTETHEIEFVENPHTIFTKIEYNDDNLYFDDIQKMDFSLHENKYVKVIVIKKTNSFLFESFIDNLNKAGTIDVIIVEDFSDVGILGDSLEVDQADDTMSIIDKVVDNLEINLQKPKIKSILRKVYDEALTLQ